MSGAQFVHIGIPNICWYIMPSNCTYIFSMRKVKASHNSVQVHHVYESYFLFEKKSRLIWHTEVSFWLSVETSFKVIRHVFDFGIEFLENKDIGIFGHFMVIDLIKRYSYHTYFSPISTSWYRRFGGGVLSVMVNDTYLWIIQYSQHCFLWNFVFYSRKVYLAHQYTKMLYHPWSYRIAIDEIPIPLKRICVLSYLCLLLT